MITGHETAKRPVQELDIDLPDGECNIWVDGSFLDKNRRKAGVGAVITDPNDDENMLLALAYNISNLKIKASKYTELWAATLAMEAMSENGITVKRITFDSPITKHRINGLRTGEINLERVLAEVEDMPDLYERLQEALEQHPDMALQHVNRKTDNMPMADCFSRIAAKRRIARIASTAQDENIPCYYHVLNGDGEVRQSFFYDSYDGYDLAMKGQREDTQEHDIQIIEDDEPPRDDCALT